MKKIIDKILKNFKNIALSLFIILPVINIICMGFVLGLIGCLYKHNLNNMSFSFILVLIMVITFIVTTLMFIYLRMHELELKKCIKFSSILYIAICFWIMYDDYLQNLTFSLISGLDTSLVVSRMSIYLSFLVCNIGIYFSYNICNLFYNLISKVKENKLMVKNTIKSID